MAAAQAGGAAEGLHQGRNVLAGIGTAEGEQGRQGGLLQQRRQHGRHRRLPAAAPGRIEHPGIHPRRNHPGPFRPEVGVVGVLALQLLAGAGDHQTAVGQGQLLGRNPPLQGIERIELGRIEAGIDQAATLLAAQRMGGEHQRQAEALLQPRSHIARIGIVGMDPIGQARGRQQAGDQLLHQPIKMGPELLLGQIAGGTEAVATDAQTGLHKLQGPGVIGVNPGILDQPGEHLDPIQFRTGGEGAGQLEHIGSLATGIGIATQFQIVAAKQPMQMEMEHHQPHRQGWAITSAIGGLGAGVGIKIKPTANQEQPCAVASGATLGRQGQATLRLF